MNFNQFLFKYREGTLDDDAAWRAYDFRASVKPRHIAKALKSLHLMYAGEHAAPRFMALYDLTSMTRTEAETLLGSWWLWTQVNANARVAGLVKRVAATSLPGDPPKASYGPP